LAKLTSAIGTIAVTEAGLRFAATVLVRRPPLTERIVRRCHASVQLLLVIPLQGRPRIVAVEPREIVAQIAGSVSCLIISAIDGRAVGFA